MQHAGHDVRMSCEHAPLAQAQCIVCSDQRERHTDLEISIYESSKVVRKGSRALMSEWYEECQVVLVHLMTALECQNVRSAIVQVDDVVFDIKHMRVW